MVVKITTPYSVTKALNYNEKKVQKGVASCLCAANFLKDVGALHFGEKLRRFKALNDLNTRAKTNTLHISLNFDPAEKLPRERLVQIAAAYMQKIGFAAQPYLVYEHRDAGHPHIHIVTTTIQENGRRIDTYNIGKNQSQKARKELEQGFGLVKAGEKKKRQSNPDEPFANQKIRYGKTDTKRAVTAVLNTVIHDYRYTSLAELNAVLRLYNLAADAGKEGSRMHRNGGLVYHVLNDDGKPIGVPIKASAITFGPTLNYLEQQFKKGAERREPYKQKLKTAIDFQLCQRPNSLADFTTGLQSEKVTVVPRKNEQEILYGLTYIDHRTKCVFNGSDLGKGYSAAAIQKRILERQDLSEFLTTALRKKGSQTSLERNKFAAEKKPSLPTAVKQGKAPGANRSVAAELLYQLLKTEKEPEDIPFELKKKGRGQ
jgi:hypothetical protein